MTTVSYLRDASASGFLKDKTAGGHLLVSHPKIFSDIPPSLCVNEPVNVLTKYEVRDHLLKSSSSRFFEPAPSKFADTPHLVEHKATSHLAVASNTHMASATSTRCMLEHQTKHLCIDNHVHLEKLTHTHHASEETKQYHLMCYHKLCQERNSKENPKELLDIAEKLELPDGLSGVMLESAIKRHNIRTKGDLMAFLRLAHDLRTRPLTEVLNLLNFGHLELDKSLKCARLWQDPIVETYKRRAQELKHRNTPIDRLIANIEEYEVSRAGVAAGVVSVTQALQRLGVPQDLIQARVTFDDDSRNTELDPAIEWVFQRALATKSAAQLVKPSFSTQPPKPSQQQAVSAEQQALLNKRVAAEKAHSENRDKLRAEAAERSKQMQKRDVSRQEEQKEQSDKWTGELARRVAAQAKQNEASQQQQEAQVQKANQAEKQREVEQQQRQLQREAEQAEKKKEEEEERSRLQEQKKREEQQAIQARKGAQDALDQKQAERKRQEQEEADRQRKELEVGRLNKEQAERDKKAKEDAARLQEEERNKQKHAAEAAARAQAQALQLKQQQEQARNTINPVVAAPIRAPIQPGLQPLPRGWVQGWEMFPGQPQPMRVFYFNQQKFFVDPRPLPPNWQQLSMGGRTYYVDHATKATRWDHPGGYPAYPYVLPVSQ